MKHRETANSINRQLVFFGAEYTCQTPLVYRKPEASRRPLIVE